MSDLKNNLLGIGAIIILAGHGIIWNFLKKLLFKPNIQELMDQGDIPSLVRALSYKKNDYDDHCIRSNAAIALGNIGTVDQIDALLAASDDIESRVQDSSLQAIGHIVFRCVRQPLFTAYQQQNVGELQHLSSLLASLQSRYTQNLIDSLHESPQAISALGAIAGPEASDALIQCLNQDEHQNTITIQALANTGDPRTIDTFIKLLSKVDHQLKITLIELLGKSRDPKAIPPLLKMLSEKNMKLSKGIVEILPSFQDPSVMEKIRPLLSSFNSKLRIVAAKSLAQLGEPYWTDIIQGTDQDFNQLENSEHPLASEVLAQNKTLKKFPNYKTYKAEKKREKHIENLNSWDESKIFPAIQALGKLGNPKSIEDLLPLLINENPKIRKATSKALEQLEDEPWTQKVKGDSHDFKRLAQSKNEKIIDLMINHTDGRKEIINALGSSKSRKAMEALLSDLDSDWYLTESKVQALGTLGFSEAIEPLKEMLLNQAPDTRRSAAKALKSLGEPQWLNIIFGTDDDFIELARSKEETMVKKAIQVLMEDLYNNHLEHRKEAAERLIKLATNPPKELKSYWSELRRVINARHTDIRNSQDLGRSSDCTHMDEHTDSGIGLKFPKLTNQFSA